MKIPLLLVDAFADRPFAGNPAAVCLLRETAEAAWMQRVAAEMNLSETAFPVRRDEAAFDLRWFTPTVEVPLCGHATLGAAHAIWESGLVAEHRRLEFSTASGSLRAWHGAGGWIEMDFPARRHEVVGGPAEAAARQQFGDALGEGVGERIEVVARSDRDWIVLLESAVDVRAMQPHMGALARLGDLIVVTAPAGGVGVDFVSRCFVPAWGIPEDPVTGAAHCGLGPFWAPRLGRTEMVGFQASARGGTVRVAVDGDRVILGGRAVTVLRGELCG